MASKRSARAAKKPAGPQPVSTTTTQGAGGKVTIKKRYRSGSTVTTVITRKSYTRTTRSRGHTVTVRYPNQTAKKRTAPGVTRGGWYANDELPLCAPVAVANAYLAATGTRLSSMTYTALCGPLSAMHGATLPDVLTRAVMLGIIEEWEECSPLEADVLGVSNGNMAHAIAATPWGYISWGGDMTTDEQEVWEYDGEAYKITWKRA